MLRIPRVSRIRNSLLHRGRTLAEDAPRQSILGGSVGGTGGSRRPKAISTYAGRAVREGRDFAMLVDRLTLVVVFERLEPIRSGDRLRGLVRLEASVQDLLAGRERRVARALVAEHQVVMGFEVLRVDFERFLEARNRLVEAPLEEADAP